MAKIKLSHLKEIKKVVFIAIIIDFDIIQK